MKKTKKILNCLLSLFFIIGSFTIKKTWRPKRRKTASHRQQCSSRSSAWRNPLLQLQCPKHIKAYKKEPLTEACILLNQIKDRKLGEVTDYATAAFSCAYTTVFFVVMNKDKWSALSDNIKKIIEEINTEWAQKHGEVWDASDLKGIKFFLNKGNTHY